MVRHSLPSPLGILVGDHVSGDGKGTILGFPTINLAVSSSSCPDATGVFIGRVQIENIFRFGLIHIGPRPTFGKTEIRTEVFVFDDTSQKSLSKHIFTPISVELLFKIREVQYFSTSEALVEQIQNDYMKAKEILKNF